MYLPTKYAYEYAILTGPTDSNIYLTLSRTDTLLLSLSPRAVYGLFSLGLGRRGTLGGAARLPRGLGATRCLEVAEGAAAENGRDGGVRTSAADNRDRVVPPVLGCAAASPP